MNIERISGISPTEFTQHYLSPGIPVIVTDAMDSWDMSRFTPAALARDFGDEFVQVYDDLFALQEVGPLRDYLATHFDKPDSDPGSRRYVRWYTKLKDVDFLWADPAFDRFKDAWSAPYFLPASSMIVPFCPPGRTISPVDTRFPYKGLFVSGRGARTRLHRDPWHSNAVLCQFYGRKKIYLYGRDQTDYVTSGEAFVDILDPDPARFPAFGKAQCMAEVILSPGEMIFFPGGSFHDVTSISDSVSITWNFLHACNIERFGSHLRQHPQEGELEIVRYFLKPWLPADASAETILRFAADNAR